MDILAEALMNDGVTIRECIEVSCQGVDHACRIYKDNGKALVVFCQADSLAAPLVYEMNFQVCQTLKEAGLKVSFRIEGMIWNRTFESAREYAEFLIKEYQTSSPYLSEELNPDDKFIIAKTTDLIREKEIEFSYDLKNFQLKVCITNRKTQKAKETVLMSFSSLEQMIAKELLCIDPIPYLKRIRDRYECFEK